MKPVAISRRKIITEQGRLDPIGPVGAKPRNFRTHRIVGFNLNGDLKPKRLLATMLCGVIGMLSRERQPVALSYVQSE